MQMEGCRKVVNVQFTAVSPLQTMEEYMSKPAFQQILRGKQHSTGRKENFPVSNYNTLKQTMASGYTFIMEDMKI